MTNKCSTRTVFSFLNNMANVPGVKFGSDNYRNMAIVAHDEDHRPCVVRETKRQTIVEGCYRVFVGRTDRSYGERRRREMIAEMLRLNRTNGGRECVGAGQVGCV